jgi:TrmH family RNA methyltransferase
LLLHPAGLESDGVRELRRRCAELGVREEEAPRALEREAHKQNCFAAIVFSKSEQALRPDTNHAVLHNISDSGNLGTILRTALGFGVEDIALIRPCVDVFDPKAVRASMGSLFSLRVRMYDDYESYAGAFAGRPVYPFMLDASIPLGEALKGKQPGPWTLVFGNEGTGLPASFAAVGQPVRIESGNRIDSLNLAVAAAIGLYEFTR